MSFRVYFSFIFLLNFSFLFSQSDEDALRYSRTSTEGTARFIGLGGAMGAMGADLSCLNNNPAGIGVYKKSDITISGGMRIAKVQSTYNDSVTRDFKTNFVVPNMGIAGAGVNTEIDKKNFFRKNFAISLNRKINFNNNISIAGQSKGTSMALGFSAAAQGKNPAALDQFYEYWPYIYDLIDTVQGNATVYESAIPQGANMRQDYQAIRSGGLSDLSMGGGYSYSDKFYGGWALGISFLNYVNSSSYTESAIDSFYKTPNSPYRISDFTYTEELRSNGKGINLKLGFIYRASQYLRLGFAYHTPSFQSVTDKYSSTFSMNYVAHQSFSDSSKSGQFKYSVYTPSKVQGSISILFQKTGCLNIDLETMNYANMYLKASQNYFGQIDKFIRNTYKRTLNLKIGAERNIKPVILRAGYTMYGSPTGEIFSGSLVRHAFSGGAGVRINNICIDVVYSQMIYKENFYLYNPQYVKAAKLKYATGQFLLTFTSKI